MSLAAATLAAALLVAGTDSHARLRSLVAAVTAPDPAVAVRPQWVAVGVLAAAAVGTLTVGGVVGAVAGAGVGAATGIAVRRLGDALDRRTRHAPVDLAAAWEVLAVCLDCGLPVTAGIEAAGALVPGSTGRRLRAVSGRLRLGADPRQAWAALGADPDLAVFARAAGRSAGTGSALASVARTQAARIRSELVDRAQEQAQRAAVRITAPLGLCFLPAFLVLGVAPIVIGLASEALARW